MLMILIYYLFLRKREQAREGKSEERENPKQALLCKCRAWRRGAWSHEPGDHDLSQNQELDALTNWATQAPLNPQIFLYTQLLTSCTLTYSKSMSYNYHNLFSLVFFFFYKEQKGQERPLSVENSLWI